jgi:short subunit dehydrogenase-like uncharacterized protein
MDGELCIYGSYGYTGSLVAERGVEEGAEPVLAGRDAERVEAQATEFGLDHEVFSLEHPQVVEHRVSEFDAVLNCAGPFSATAEPLIDACLDAGTDYVDIAGRIQILEAIARRDDEAKAAGITLLPGVGYDVVPTDCLAVYLADQVDEPTTLRLAMDELGTYSAGTLKSIIEGLDRPGLVRQNGEIRDVPAAWKTRAFAFDGGTKQAITVPWGDVSTAYYATGVPTIEVYANVPSYAHTVMEQLSGFAPVYGSKPVQRVLKAAVDLLVSGPTAEKRAGSITRIVGEIEGENGEQAAARMRTPDTYDVTAMTAVESARRVVDGEVEAGVHTPGDAFGADYVLDFPGIEREDVDVATLQKPASAGR